MEKGLVAMVCIGRLRRTSRGFAYVATLVLVVVFVAMVTAALRSNAKRHTWLRLQKDGVRAQCLAESGVAEAMNAIAAKRQTDTMDGTIGLGRFSAKWAPVENAAGVDSTDVLEIVSVGTIQSRIPAPIRRTVRVRVRVARPFPNAPIQLTTLSWEKR